MEQRTLLNVNYLSYNWVFLENEVDTYKSNSQLIYSDTEINDYAIIKRG
jgi:hypothetical protein